MEGREAGEPACSRTEGAQGMPGEGLKPCIPSSLFFPTLLVLKVSAAFSGGLPAPCSSVAGSGAWLMACTALKKLFYPAAGRRKLGNRVHAEHSPRTQSKICSSGCCGGQAVARHPLQTLAEVKAKAASLPVRPRLRIPTGHPATSPAGMLGAPLAGLASEFASFSWPIRQILAGANRGSSGK